MVSAYQSYKKPFWAINEHWETIIPSLLRWAPTINYDIEWLKTIDDDEIQLNFKRIGSEKIAILIPGLESNAERAYVRRMAKLLLTHGFDVLVPDHRGCGFRTNKNYRSYHSGNSTDLNECIEHIKDSYKEITLIGFSLGGSIVLNFLADYPDNPVTNAVTISAPLDLNASSKKLEQPKAKLYNDRFVKKLAKRLSVKVPLSNGQLYKSELNACITLRDIDNIYTAPAHGFKNAHDYYVKCSAIGKINHVTTETFIIHGANDPLIDISQEQWQQLIHHPSIKTCITKQGGHVAHPTPFLLGTNWYEENTIDWLLSQPSDNREK